MGDAPTPTPSHPTTTQLQLTLLEMQQAEHHNLDYYSTPLLLAQQHH
jgi:hypothetical protein